MTVNKGLDAGPDLVLSDVPQAEWRGESAVIRARLVRAGLAFEPFGGWMKRREPLGQLVSKKRKGGHAAERRQMTGPGVVPDKRSGTVNYPEQLGYSSRCGDAGFTGLKPPLALIGITGNLDAVFGLAQSSGEPAEAFEGPHPDRLR